MGIFDRLKTGLSRSSRALGENLGSIIGRRRLDKETLQELEELLISSDLGLSASADIIANIAQKKIEGDVSEAEVKEMLASEITDKLTPHSSALNPDTYQPYVILMTGVNGAGKTTTIGKLANKFQSEGKSVMLAAGDTFRAAAIEQLTIWGERANVPVITTKQGGDAAGLAYDALQQAKTSGTDILMIDTA